MEAQKMVKEPWQEDEFDAENEIILASCLSKFAETSTFFLTALLMPNRN
jgi:hypothetical protein